MSELKTVKKSTKEITTTPAISPQTGRHSPPSEGSGGGFHYETETEFIVLGTVEPVVRVLRRTDCIRPAECKHIFRTLGADPHDLSYFWVLPPLMGIIVQPIVGSLSDKTWTRFGRRIPYLFVGATVAVLVMCLLPNAGSLGLAVSSVMMFGLLMLMLLDTSINMAMQPFKMMVGDMVNEEQKAKAYSIQSFLCNAGSVVGFLFPYIFAAVGIANIAAPGVVPPSVVWSFYIGAAILIICVIYTTIKVREWNPQEYREYNPVAEDKEDKANWFTLLKNAPATFWKVGLVQFFCWAALLYMWTYVVDAVAETVWNSTDSASEEYQVAGNWTGVLYAIQAMGSVVWATILPRFKNTKMAYAVSLVLGGIGFALIPFVPNQYGQIIPFLLIGCAWAAMLAMPFTFVTNALQGDDCLRRAARLRCCLRRAHQDLPQRLHRRGRHGGVRLRK